MQFYLCVLICASLFVLAETQQPFQLYWNQGQKLRPINDREFLRSYNLHNVNTLASLSRYGDMLEKRFIARHK